MADIPQSLYEAMRNWEFAFNGVHHLQSGFSVELETWLPILQGIADKGFSEHPPCLQRFFLQLLSNQFQNQVKEDANETF